MRSTGALAEGDAGVGFGLSRRHATSYTGDGAFAGARDQLAVFGEDTGLVVRVAGLPGREAARDFGGGNVQVEDAAFGIDDNRVALGDDGDGAAVESLGCDMGDHEAVGGSAEAAVGERGNAIAESGAYHGAGDAEHFAHAESAD